MYIRSYCCVFKQRVKYTCQVYLQTTYYNNTPPLTFVATYVHAYATACVQRNSTC